ncbi:MAG: hypothetical protein AAFZ65_14660, partial [Planctomycetota bacterium]
MDILTLIGVLMGFGLLGFSIATGNGGMALFIDLPSMMIVFGGTIAVFLMNFTIPDLKALVPVFMRTLMFQLSTPAEEIQRVVSYATLARWISSAGVESWNISVRMKTGTRAFKSGIVKFIRNTAIVP